MAGIEIDGVNNKIDFDDDKDTSISANVDDTLVVEVGGNTLATVTSTSVTFNDGVEITTADNTDTLTLTSTDTDSDSAPNLRLYRNSGSPAVGDNIGQIDFEGRNDASEDVVYARLMARVRDESDATEDGGFQIDVMKGAVLRSLMKYFSDGSAQELSFNDDSIDMDFRVETGDQTHGLFVDGGNNMVAVNNSTYDNAQFKVQQDTASRLMARFNHEATSGNCFGVRFEFKGQAPDNHTSDFLVAGDTVASRLFILADGDIQNHDNSYGAISDERLKDQIKDSGSQWNDIKSVKVKKFKFKSDISDKGDSDSLWRLGVTAQDLEASGMSGLVKQEILFEADDPDLKDNQVGDIKKHKSVKYSILYMKAIKALQEAMERIEELETKVEALENA